jgi:hypothetical protein
MMVCPYDSSRLLLILQIDHSRIAGWIAGSLGAMNDSPDFGPYASMVLAAQEHDSGWWEWEDQTVGQRAGLSIDYIGSIKHLGPGSLVGPLSRRDRAARRAATVCRLFRVDARRSPFNQGMGLLPSMPDYRNDPAVQNFIAEQKVAAQLAGSLN